MISANELKIGNKLYESSLDSPSTKDFSIIEVAVINDINEVIRDLDDNIYSYDYLYPIPLTHEILEKCGLFIEDDVYRAPNNYWFGIDYKEGNFYLAHDYKKIWIEFLHQLQNLYFALTGEELEIKL